MHSLCKFCAHYRVMHTFMVMYSQDTYTCAHAWHNNNNNKHFLDSSENKLFIVTTSCHGPLNVSTKSCSMSVLGGLCASFQGHFGARVPDARPCIFQQWSPGPVKATNKVVFARYVSGHKLGATHYVQAIHVVVITMLNLKSAGCQCA